MQQLSVLFGELLEAPAIQAALILVGSILVALVVRFIFRGLFSALVSKTRTDLDNTLLEAARGPVVQSVLLVGAACAALVLGMPETPAFITFALLKTVAVIIWSRAIMRLGTIVLEALSRRIDSVRWIEPKTLPLLEMALTVAVIAGSLYFAFVAWEINVTSWLASAGIVGIAVGFAAKDTLANLFAGVFIVADAPYKIGDFVILDDVIRGQVVDIGIRSSRLLTRDDVEVTVPNAVISNARIVNETGGRHQKMRVRVKVAVAYGSDLDQVSEVLLGCVGGANNVCSEPEPRVRFRTFGDSGLDLELLAWIEEPVYRGRVLHELNTRVYNALNQAGIEIPYPKRDVYIKEQPRPAEGA